MTGPDKTTLARPSRRAFAKSLAAMAAVPLVAGSQPPAIEANASQAASQPPSPVAEKLAEIVRERYGKYLEGEQLDEVTRSIERSQRSADTMKQFKLTNSDEPAFAFSANLP